MAPRQKPIARIEQGAARLVEPLRRRNAWAGLRKIGGLELRQRSFQLSQERAAKRFDPAYAASDWRPSVFRNDTLKNRQRERIPLEHERA